LLYHVDSQTGKAGACKAGKQCEFGKASAHFTSEAAALNAYEKLQRARVEKAGKLEAASASYLDFNYLKDLSKSKVIKLPLSDVDNYDHEGRKFIGARSADGLSGSMVSSVIRREISKAVNAGELPKDVSYKVQMVGTSTFRIAVGLEDGSPWLSNPDVVDLNHFAAYKHIAEYLTVLGNQWKTDYSNPMLGIFDARNSCRVDQADDLG
jgi:hypothetical protein